VKDENMSAITIESARAQRTSYDLQSGTPVVSAHQLSFSFPSGRNQQQVLFDVNLDIHPGEIVLLTGPSGSGKTTLLTLVGGLRTVRSGQLNVLGQDISNARPRSLIALRRKIGFVFQSHNLLEYLTVRRNVELALELHPDIPVTEARRQSEEILYFVGLADYIDQYPSTLSVGQRQRVAIARALAARPKLVLADEPTAALDSRMGRDVATLLERLSREQGCTILMVTHDNRVLDIADRVVKMEDGRMFSHTAHARTTGSDSCFTNAVPPGVHSR
jgi:putative ABC transport system ATP-binding protein